MQRKPGFPTANCNIKMPDSAPGSGNAVMDEESEQLRRRQILINFGHSQWGFNNWSWSVTKQELDFADYVNGRYMAGVVSFVSVTVKNLNIHRENTGYASSSALMKGSAIYQARKASVTNALKETLLSFGGNLTTELLELLAAHKIEAHEPPQIDLMPENNQKLQNKALGDTKNNAGFVKKDEVKDDVKDEKVSNVKQQAQVLMNSVAPLVPMAKAGPMNMQMKPMPVANQQRPPPPAPLPRPPSNVSYVFQPMMPPVFPPHLPPPPPFFPTPFYDYNGWHFFEGHHGNVNLNFNVPPQNLVVNNRAAECRNACRMEGEPLQYGVPPPPQQGCWIKPSMFYDGFWTEQKVKKWVAEQVEKQSSEERSQKSSSPNHHVFNNK